MLLLENKQTGGFAHSSNIADFVSTDEDTWVPEVTAELQRKITAAGVSVALTATKDYGVTATYVVNAFANGVASTTALSTGGVVSVGLSGYGANVTNSLVTASQAGIATAVISAINLGRLSSTFVASANGSNVVLQKQDANKATEIDPDFTAYPSMSFGTWVNGLSNTANYASYTLQQISKTPSAGSWRITAVNNSSLKANNLDDDELFITD